MDTVGKRIRLIRKENKLTQQQLADKLGVSRSFLNRLENEKENPSLILLKLISKSFNVSFEWLQLGIGEIQPVKTTYQKRQELRNMFLSKDVIEWHYGITIRFMQAYAYTDLSLLLNNEIILNNDEDYKSNKMSYINTINDIILALHSYTKFSTEYFRGDFSEFITDDEYEEKQKYVREKILSSLNELDNIIQDEDYFNISEDDFE